MWVCESCDRPVQFCTRCHACLRYACPACHHLQPHGQQCDACGVDFAQYETEQLQRARDRAQAKTVSGASWATRATLVGVGVLVLGAGAWWGVRMLSSPPPPNTPAVAPPVQAPAPAADAQSAADALRALQELRALTQGRLTYMEYGPRAFEARKLVDRHLAAAGGDAEFKRGASETMDLYMLAATAWNAGLRADSGNQQGAAEAFASVSRDPALAFCAAARDARDNAKASRASPRGGTGDGCGLGAPRHFRMRRNPTR